MNLLFSGMLCSALNHIWLCNVQEEIIQLDLDKPQAGGLGFSVIGGERGIFVKSITPGGIAESSGELQVGDRLLKVGDVYILFIYCCRFLVGGCPL